MQRGCEPDERRVVREQARSRDPWLDLRGECRSPPRGSTKTIGHARSWSLAKGSGRGVRLSPISTNSLAMEPRTCPYRLNLAGLATVRLMFRLATIWLRAALITFAGTTAARVLWSASRAASRTGPFLRSAGQPVADGGSRAPQPRNTSMRLTKA